MKKHLWSKGRKLLNAFSVQKVKAIQLNVILTWKCFEVRTMLDKYRDSAFVQTFKMERRSNEKQQFLPYVFGTTTRYCMTIYCMMFVNNKITVCFGRLKSPPP